MRNIPFGKPLIGAEEKEAVMQVLNSPILVHGPKTKAFETAFASYAGAPYAISVSSCTAAMHLSYFYLGISKGDEVIVPAQTHTATAHAVELCGAKPVFIDSEKDTGNIDLDQIESAITENTKALSVVHYLGMPVNMEKIVEIAKKHNLFVVEDCALAIGSYFKGTHAGLYGDVGCFSFYPVKHMTTAEGGMLITKHKEIADKVDKVLKKNPAYMSYYRLIRERIRNSAYHNYKSQKKGEVLLSFLIDKDGSLKGIDLAPQSVKNRSLRKIALKSIRESAPFPEFPEGLRQYTRLQFNISIYFKNN